MDVNTPPQQPGLTRRESKDLNVLALFAAVYCRSHHFGERTPLVPPGPEYAPLQLVRYPLCADCRKFLAYAFSRRRHCPLDPKPACKNCPVHCYRSDYREQVRRIMRFSGRHLLLRGRLDLLWHYLF